MITKRMGERVVGKTPILNKNKKIKKAIRRIGLLILKHHFSET